jgi:hypothetical protein
MLVEVDLPNSDIKLMPGMYRKVRLTTSGSAGAIVAPDDALIFRDDSVYLPVVRASHLHLTRFQMGTTMASTSSSRVSSAMVIWSL